MTELPQDQSSETLGITTRTRRRKRRTVWQRLRRRFRHINWLLFGLVVVAVIAVAVVGTLVIVSNARKSVADSWDSLNRVVDLLSRTPGTEWTLEDFDRLQASTSDLSAALRSAKARTGFLRPFAGLDSEYETTFEVLDTASEVVLAGEDLLNGVEPTLFFLAGGSEGESVTVQVSSGERVVELLSLGRGQFIAAQFHLDSAAQHLDALTDASVAPGWLGTIEDIAGFHRQLNEINTILINGPELLTQALGLADTRNYLVLSQNSDELRPSGGYISTYGWLEIRNGRITDYDYSATTARSPIPPRDGEVDVPVWWIQYQNPIYAAWDGSWSPDFPTTAEMAAWYYDAGNNAHSPVDGVIAIDIVGFEYILEGLGSVVVPEYQEIVTPETFREVVYEVRAEGRAELEHKQFVASLYREIFNDWQNIDRERSGELFGVLLRALQEKHIMLYFRDNMGLNQAVDTLGWSGKQRSAVDHDYIMVVDTNLGSKSNRSITRQLIYDVGIQSDGSLESRLTVSYDFPASVAMLDPAVSPAHYSDIDYSNLLQVFVPVGSALTGTNNLSYDPDIESGVSHTEFITQTVVPYNNGERFQFRYTTPPMVESFGPYQRYRLLLQKQPGMIGENASIQVRLPQGSRMISTSPPVETTYNLEQQVLEFRVELVTDQWIEVIFDQ